jgi:hypothetical protein
VLPDDDHRSKHVGAFKCFNVCFRIIQYILVHLLVLIISDTGFSYSVVHKYYFHLIWPLCPGGCTPEGCTPEGCTPLYYTLCSVPFRIS